MTEPVVEHTDQTADQVPPTNDELDSAWKDATAEPEVETTTPEEDKEPVTETTEETVVETTDEPPKIDPEEHSERTRLGRRVSKLEDMLSEVLEQNRLLIQKQAAGTENETIVERPEFDMTDPEDFERFLDWRERKKEEAKISDQNTYARGYISEIRKWESEAEKEFGKDTAAEMYKLLTDETPGSAFNVRRSNNPKADFEVNLAKAEAHFFRTRASKPQERTNPLERNKGISPKPTAVGGRTQSDKEKGTQSMSFDEHEQAMIKRMGWTPEEASKFLSKPPPMHLTRGR